jgi:hypothetical protein
MLAEALQDEPDWREILRVEKDRVQDGDDELGLRVYLCLLTLAARGLTRRPAEARIDLRWRRERPKIGDACGRVVIGAALGLVLGILVSVTAGVPFAPEVGLLLGGLVGWFAATGLRR